MNKKMKHNYNNLTRKVLYDLFVTTENIIKGLSSITIKPVVNGFLECKIHPPGNQPTIVLSYDFRKRQSSNEDAIGKADLNVNQLSKNKNRMPIFSQLSLSAPSVSCEDRKPIKVEVITENSSGSNLEVLTTPVRSNKTNSMIGKHHFKESNASIQVTENRRKLPDRRSSRITSGIKQTNDPYGSATRDQRLSQQSSKESLTEVVDSKPPDLFPQPGRKKGVNKTPFKRTYKRKWTKNSIHESSNARMKYKCLFCNRHFYDIKRKIQHENLHKSTTSFKCAFCAMPFTNFGNKLAHERIHTGEKPYKCKYCGRGFTQSANRKTHERIHTGERPYSCSYCGKRFIQLSCKNAHEKQHKNITAEFAENVFKPATDE